MNHIDETCRELKDQLSAFLDGELDEAVCREIERHLNECGNCRVMVDTLKKTIVLYRDAPRESVPPEAEARLFKVLDLEELKKRPPEEGSK